MRARTPGAMARLLVIVMLVAGTVLSGVPIGSPPGVTSPDAPIAQGKDKAAKAKGTKRSKTSKPKGNKRNKQKGGKKKQRNRNTPAALDAQAIARENADEAADCEGLERIQVDGVTFCTHGRDPQLFGAGAAGEAEAPSAARTASSRALCIGDGVSGPRIQLIYAYRNDRPNRLNELLPTFRRLASEMDTIVDQSAAKTGGSLRIRFVTNAQCQVDVKAVGVPANALDGFGTTMEKLREAGHGRIDRKYLILADDDAFCGIGTFAKNDTPDTVAHDFTGYARVDRICWDPGTMVHELGHTLGAVQYSAPHTSRGAHCIDEWDVMCYRDEPFRPKMKYFCTDGLGEFRLDCRDDDYFAANPAPGSYLSRHWNMADSIYFTDGDGIGCVDAAREPDDAYWYDFWEVPFPKTDVGERAALAFCEDAGDTDWLLFEGERGSSYQIETSDLAAEVDTQLVVYRGYEEQHWDGMDQIAVNDDRTDGDASSLITFVAPSDGSYLVGVSEAGERAGRNLTYTLSITEVPTTRTGPLSLSRPSAKPKGAFSATLRDVDPQATVTFWWQRGGEARELGQATAGDDGAATGQFKVPKGAARGIWQVEGLGSDGSFGAAELRVEKEGGRDGKKKHKKGKSKKGKKGKGRRGKH